MMNTVRTSINLLKGNQCIKLRRHPAHLLNRKIQSLEAKCLGNFVLYLIKEKICRLSLRNSNIKRTPTNLLKNLLNLLHSLKSLKKNLKKNQKLYKKSLLILQERNRMMITAILRQLCHLKRRKSQRINIKRRRKYRKKNPRVKFLWMNLFKIWTLRRQQTKISYREINYLL